MFSVFSVAGRVGAAFCGYGRPVIMQRPVHSLQRVEVPQTQLSPVTVDIPVGATEKGSTSSRAGYGGDARGFGAFCAIFRALPVIPELSASFSSFRALTPVSARGLPWVPESPGVSLPGDSATGFVPISSRGMQWIYTLAHMSLNNNNNKQIQSGRS